MHVNKNMLPALAQGIAQGELAITDPAGDDLLALAYRDLSMLTEQLNRPTGRFMLAKDEAKVQGFIGAYRTGTEY